MINQFIEKHGLAMETTPIAKRPDGNESFPQATAGHFELKIGNGNQSMTVYYSVGGAHRAWIKDGKCRLAYEDRKRLGYKPGARVSWELLQNKSKWAAGIVEKFTKAVCPPLSDVLECLRSDASAMYESFENWCDEFGYDNDSIKALTTHSACQKIGLDLIGLVGKDGLDELFEAEF